MPRSASESQRASSTARPSPRKVRTTCVSAVDDALRAKLMVRAVSARPDIGRIVTALLRARLPPRASLTRACGGVSIARQGARPTDSARVVNPGSREATAPAAVHRDRAPVAYRRDIDGLRAVAVLAVAFDHARLPGFAGGYVGVDVFFVISGYLITQILTRELDRGAFSVLGFYERRIRRIFPALFVVQLVTLAIGCWLLLPDDLVALARSAVATTFVSFVLCAVGTQNYREAAFYLAPTRAWELGLGCLLALGGERVALRKAARELAALAGLALIAYSVVAYGADTHFPGFATLPPVVGAALILWAGVGGSSAVGRALSTRPAVFFGLISYSLYLWHWPLLVYATYYLVRPLTPLEASGVVALSTALAAASWRWVERPFRGADSSIRTKPLFAAAASVSLATAALGVGIAQSGGLPRRIDEKVSRYVETRAERASLTERCSRDETGASHPPFTRALGDSRAADPSFVVWGDSHACMFAEEIGVLARRDARRGFFAWGGGCPPLLLGPGASEGDGCEAASERLLAALPAGPQLR